ncbi:TIGR03086 family metal-binding protein [Streptomyces nanhaiensis]|uniref:TIGR03086 family metal-binding protein n=1 Tax=Streptomyces nanhaiensis TaxID=679319 RepID=UPI00399CB323
MNTIADRYRRRADAFASTVSGVAADRWGDPSPCEGWTARDVVRHVIDMHAAMLRPLDRVLSPAPPLREDPLGAFLAARTDIEAVLADPGQALRSCPTPLGPTTVERHIDEVVSDDMALHRWDLARATGQDGSMDPVDVERLWAVLSAVPRDVMDRMRTPDAFGPGVRVYGPEVAVPEGASLQDRLLAATGRDPRR